MHAGGDGAGRELMRALVAAARATPSIEILEGFEARRLIVDENAVRGVLAVGPAGPALFPASRIVIATGGIGGLFEESTNPLGSFGQGVALAARAGAALADMEFVQFHPTALDVAQRPMPLVSEAVRGAGATLIDETGERFMAGTPGAELAPRDIVARAIWRRRAQGHRVFLDARAAIGRSFAQRFPIIWAACRRAGVDPAREPIPVRPAQHYHMGGVAVDAEGRSSVEGLWVCGEAACTGLHGANRLASNSLTEAAVFGARRDRIAVGCRLVRRRPAARGPLPQPPVPAPASADPILPPCVRSCRCGGGHAGRRDACARLSGRWRRSRARPGRRLIRPPSRSRSSSRRCVARRALARIAALDFPRAAGRAAPIAHHARRGPRRGRRDRPAQPYKASLNHDAHASAHAAGRADRPPGAYRGPRPRRRHHQRRHRAGRPHRQNGDGVA